MPLRRLCRAGEASRCQSAQQACHEAEQVVQDVHETRHVAQEVRGGTYEIAERRARRASQREPDGVERNLEAEKIDVVRAKVDLKRSASLRLDSRQTKR